MSNINLKIVNRFNRLVVKDPSRARIVIKQTNYKDNAYYLHCIALTYRDEAMFQNKTEMRKVFIKRKLNLAKKYIDKAFSINADCRDVLYIKGTIYNALGDTLTAIDCYIKILDAEENLGSPFNCSNSDLPFVKMILNDARFQLYRLFYDLEDFKLSTKFLVEYKKHLKQGVDTIYKPLKNFLMSS